MWVDYNNPNYVVDEYIIAPISFILLASITFIYLSSFRLYINENIYKAFDLSNISPIGKKLNVSVIIAVVIILVWILGNITARFTSKKIKNNTTLYLLSALFATCIYSIYSSITCAIINNAKYIYDFMYRKYFITESSILLV